MKSIARLSAGLSALLALAAVVLFTSLKAQNAKSLLEQPNVDGALVGGASLKTDDFLPIIRAAESVQKS